MRVESDVLAGRRSRPRALDQPQANRRTLAVAIEIDVLDGSAGLLPGLMPK